MPTQPRAERPAMPAGYLAEKRIAWPWAEARLLRSRNYWVATTTKGGQPHARPVWGVWHDGAFFFSSGSKIRENLERGSGISVNLESGDECVIFEGVASPLEDLDVVKVVTSLYNGKYQWNLEPKPGEFFLVRPRVVFGWLCDPSGSDGGALFSQTATRWVFPSAPGQGRLAPMRDR